MQPWMRWKLVLSSTRSNNSFDLSYGNRGHLVSPEGLPKLSKLFFRKYNRCSLGAVHNSAVLSVITAGLSGFLLTGFLQRLAHAEQQRVIRVPPQV